MNGVHDMGGMHGFGQIVTEPNEPIFHEPWEGRVLAMNFALLYLGQWNMDVSRYWIEKLPAALYLSASYYGKWHFSFEEMAQHYGLVDADELAAGHSLQAPKPVQRIMTKADLNFAFSRRSPIRPSVSAPLFGPGDRVRTKNINTASHTRLPRYARDRVGTVEAVRGCHVYPDAVVSEGREVPQWLYTVVFDARTLWGEESDPTVLVSVEAFEPYLVAA